TAALDNLVVLAPAPEWVAGLPGGKLPDRSDFRRFGDDEARRMAVWRRALAESRRLADEFADAVARGGPIEARPL
ncbi:MAG: phospholipase, partial [Pseudomonadota bacterium]